MNKFKIGEKVYVQKLGLWGVVVMFTAHDKVKLKLENGNFIFGPITDCEKFIEPKYKIGTKIVAFPSCNYTDVAQIVGRHLNKKKGEYTYLAFTLESGLEIAMPESRVKLAKVDGIKQVKKLLENVKKIAKKDYNVDLNIKY